MKIKIDCDVFDIVNRIKQIDDGYFVMFNTDSKKFEIHNKNTKNSYCLTIPYTQLDVRTIELIEKTHVKNYKKIVEELEVNNEKIQKNALKELKDINDYKIRELLRYSEVATKNLDRAFNTTWI